MSLKEKLMIPLYLIFLLGVVLVQVSGTSHQKSLHMLGLGFRKIPTEIIGSALEAHPDIRELYMADNSIDEISKTDFPESAAQLTFLSVRSNKITHIAEGAFNHMVHLEEVDLGENYITELTDLGAKNLKILNLTHNSIAKVEKNALKNFKKLEKLVLSGNPLTSIAEDGLLGPENLKFLYLRSTQLERLPSTGISSLIGIDVQDSPSLRNLPSADKFTMLTEANLTYGMQCCAFIAYNKKRDEKRGKRKNRKGIFFDDNQSALANNSELARTATGLFISENDIDEPLRCFPAPTVFTPCNDILGSDVLRTFTWVIAALAIIGNLGKLMVVSRNQQPMSPSKLLVYNLGFANFLMGAYLFGLACTDADTFGVYYNHVPGWQFDGGCQAFGFLAVFSVNLSMCCLTLLAIERFLLINFTTQIGELNMSHILYCLVGAWVYSVAMAILPTTNLVSSYVTNAVCLPLDVHDGSAKGFVTWLLLSFVISFVIILYCFMEVLRKSDDTDTHVDSHTHVINVRIAKRLLVITSGSFACWLPISVIGLSVMYSHFNFNFLILKFLLMLFFPFHSVLTPVLYTILNKPFRKDAWHFVRTTCKPRKNKSTRANLLANTSTTINSNPNNKDGQDPNDIFHIDVPNDSSSSYLRKQIVSIIEEGPESDDPHALIACKNNSICSSSKDNSRENAYTYSPTNSSDSDMKRYRSVSSHVVDNSKRFSDARYRSDTTATCSTGVSATSDVELLEL